MNGISMRIYYIYMLSAMMMMIIDTIKNDLPGIKSPVLCKNLYSVYYSLFFTLLWSCPINLGNYTKTVLTDSRGINNANCF
jgi:hypothetical protein